MNSSDGLKRRSSGLSQSHYQFRSVASKPTMRPLTESAAYRFGPFAVDGRAGELRVDGRRVHLQQQPLQVLLILLRSPGQLITREELRRAIWPENTFVEFD